MTWMIVVSCALLTAWIVEWGQRQCEVWAQLRDRDL